MTQYALFDFTVSDPSPVTGWIDTDVAVYTLPDLRGLLVLTQEQWDGRFPNPSGWAVVGGNEGTLVPFTSPLPLPLQAQIALAAAVAEGISVTSESLPAINATYALDSVSTAQIFQIGTFANSFGVFPSGGTIQPYPDITGIPRMFTVPVFIAFLRATAGLVSNLQTQTGIMANGGTPTWPVQTASLV